MKYFPEIFIPDNLSHAKDIILTPSSNLNKWNEETKDTVDCILANSALDSESLVLDYGCGVGRVSGLLIQSTGCKALGVDFSIKMLFHSIEYLKSPNFVPCPKDCLSLLTTKGLHSDIAISIWTLQHCLNPIEDLGLIHHNLKKDGLFFVLNKNDRYVPITPKGRFAEWLDDKINVHEEILKLFEFKKDIPTTGLFLDSEKQNDFFFRIYKKI